MIIDKIGSLLNEIEDVLSSLFVEDPPGCPSKRFYPSRIVTVGSLKKILENKKNKLGLIPLGGD